MIKQQIVERIYMLLEASSVKKKKKKKPMARQEIRGRTLAGREDSGK